MPGTYESVASSDASRETIGERYLNDGSSQHRSRPYGMFSRQSPGHFSQNSVALRNVHTRNYRPHFDYTIIKIIIQTIRVLCSSSMYFVYFSYLFIYFFLFF